MSARNPEPRRNREESGLRLVLKGVHMATRAATKAPEADTVEETVAGAEGATTTAAKKTTKTAAKKPAAKKAATKPKGSAEIGRAHV